MPLFESLNHPLRRTLAAEAHARPFMSFEAPAQLTHLALYSESGKERHGEVLAALCRAFGVAAPEPSARHFSHDFGHFRLKWEHHAEFCTYTFLSQPGGGEAFADPPIRQLPEEWLAGLAGTVLAAAHIAVEKGEPLSPGEPRLHQLFPVPPLVGSRVLEGGEVWTDFHLAADGFSRFLVRDSGLRESQTGRLVQRICEIETYRLMALLGLPEARRSEPQLAAIEAELFQLGQRIESEDDTTSDETLLHELSRLGSRIGTLTLETGDRYEASQAYYRLVRARIAELRETRIEGAPTIGEFMERRLAPAIDTCISAATHQERLAGKIARGNDLLRTRVGIAQEKQTQAVLRSLSRSARLQLRLQQAVEGLSVVAIAYYLAGLSGYALKGLARFGLALDVDATLAALLPLLCLATWWGLRRLHRSVNGKPAAEE